MMLRSGCLFLAGAALAAFGANAQNTFPTSGNAGIGTTSPAVKLQVAGSGNAPSLSSETGIVNISGSPSQELAIGADSTGPYDMWLQAKRSWNDGTYWPLVLNPLGGNVGVGTTTPGAPLEIDQSGTSVTLGQFSNNLRLNNQQNSVGGAGNEISFQGMGASLGTAVYAAISAPIQGAGVSGSMGNLVFSTKASQASVGLTPAMTILNTGSVGIGTTSPAYNLDVAGAIHASGTVIASGGVTFPDGSIQTQAFSSALCGGDYAESVDVTGSRGTFEPGDVLEVDPNNSGKFLKASQPYSTMVAGVYSTKPGMVGRRQLTPKDPDEIPMAVVGIVPTKVTAENGPIRRGDLLVSSSKPGYAMKGTDRSQLTGAVVGKALAPLDSGAGVIEVLVTLQ